MRQDPFHVSAADFTAWAKKLRDGFFLEYFGVVVEDATHQAGPEFVQKAAIYNIETFFGWVSSVADFKSAFGQAERK